MKKPTIPTQKKLSSIEITASVNGLNKTASELQLAIDDANVGVWSLNIKKQELVWSALHKKMWGYDEHRSDLTYEDWHKAIIPEDKAKVLKKVEDALLNNSFYEVEYRIKKVDDLAIRYIRSVGNHHYNHEGDAEAFRGISIDITEQKKSEKALEKTASHLKLATDAAKVGVWSLDIETQELEWSLLHKTMWGYDENRTDLTYEDWHKLILPEDKELAFENVEYARVNHTQYEVEYRIKTANKNSIRWMRSIGQYYYNEAGDAVTLTGISMDITVQKESEERIKESERQFRTFADSIQNLAWIANPDGWIYWYNQKWYDYTGTTLKEMEGWGWEKVHHPLYTKKVMDFVKKAWKKDQAFELTFPLRRHDGEYRWFLTRSYPVKDAKGIIERWIGTNTDITDQKQTELQLQKSESFNNGILSSLSSSIAVIDKDGTLIAVNKAWNNYANENGVTSLDKVSAGSNYFEVCKKAIESGDTIAAKALLGINAVLKKKSQSFEMEYPCHSPQLERWFMLTVVKFGNDTSQVVISHQDITERKKVEEELRITSARLQLATNAASLGVWDYNVLENTLVWDNNMFKLYGIKPHEFSGAYEAWESGLHPDDLLIVQQELEKAIKGEKEYNPEFRVVWPDKSVHYIKANALLQKDANGKAIRMIGTNQDITEQTQFEIQKKKLMDDIIQRNKHLEQFSYIISHNLRLPVANMLGLIALLDGDNEPTELEYIKNSIKISASKLDEIIKDLNDILQVKNKISERKELVNFTSIASDIYLSIENMIIKADATITWDFSAVPEMMTIKSYLHSIFYNLISNSLKYRQHQILTLIEIKSFILNDKIILVFKDNGMGIDLKKQNNMIFGLYKRFHIDQAEGKGVGLYMVKTQVETIGGSISIKSEVNQGTEFKIELPI